MRVLPRRLRPLTVGPLAGPLVPGALVRSALVPGALVLVALVLGACGGEDAAGGGDRHEADVYAAVVRAAAPPAVDDELPVVYVAPVGDAEQISLDSQVAVVDRLDDEVTVRFVDDSDEAIDDESERGLVHDDGVLVRIGPVPAGTGPMTVTADRIVSDSDRAVVDYRVSMAVTEDGDVWTAVPVAERPLPTTVPPTDG